jgi:hypothetical protein
MGRIGSGQRTNNKRASEPQLLKAKGETQKREDGGVLTDCLVACAFCLGSSYCLILEPAADPPGAMAGFRPPALGPGSCGSKGKQCVRVCACVCRDWQHHFETRERCGTEEEERK